MASDDTNVGSRPVTRGHFDQRLSKGAVAQHIALVRTFPTDFRDTDKGSPTICSKLHAKWKAKGKSVPMNREDNGFPRISAFKTPFQNQSQRQSAFGGAACLRWASLRRDFKQIRQP